MEARQLALALAAERASRRSSRRWKRNRRAEGRLTAGLLQSMPFEQFEADYEVGDEIGRGVSVPELEARVPYRAPTSEVRGAAAVTLQLIPRASLLERALRGE